MTEHAFKDLEPIHSRNGDRVVVGQFADAIHGVAPATRHIQGITGTNASVPRRLARRGLPVRDLVHRQLGWLFDRPVLASKKLKDDHFLIIPVSAEGRVNTAGQVCVDIHRAAEDPLEESSHGCGHRVPEVDSIEHDREPIVECCRQWCRSQPEVAVWIAAWAELNDVVERAGDFVTNDPNVGPGLKGVAAQRAIEQSPRIENLEQLRTG